MSPGMGMGSAAASRGLSVLDLAEKYAGDPELPYRVGRHLWGRDSVLLIVSPQLEDIESLSTGTAQILLASTIPTDVARAKLYETLKKHWEEGPATLEAAGLVNSVVSEPGFLAVIKSLPRKDADQQRLPTRGQRYRTRQEGAGQPGGGMPGGGLGMPGQAGAGQPRPGQGRVGAAKGGRGDRGPAGPGQGAPGQQADHRPEHPDFLWMDTSEALVRSMCVEFAAAAKAAAKEGKEVDPETRPIEIPPSANVIAEYDFDWPDSLSDQGSLSGVSLDQMKIHYLRMQQETSPTKVFAYFRRKMVRPSEHAMEDGWWMESFRTMPQSDRKQSIDIVVTQREEPKKKDRKGAFAGLDGPGGARGQAGMFGMPGAGPGAPPGAGQAGRGLSGAGQGGRGTRGGPAGALGGQQGDRDRLEKDQPAELVIEVLAVEVKSPAPIANRSESEEK